MAADRIWSFYCQIGQQKEDEGEDLQQEQNEGKEVASQQGENQYLQKQEKNILIKTSKKSLYNCVISTVKIQYLLPLTTSLITNVCLITLAKIKKAIILVT